MGELHTVQLCARPFHAGVGGTFAEIHVVFAREALDVFVGKHQRLIHKPVDHQAEVILGQLNRTRVVTFERTALRGDRAF